MYDSGAAGLPVDNGAFRYGYGIFETMLIENGRIALSKYHFERLFAGMKALHFNVPKLLTAKAFENYILLTVEKNDLSTLCRVRLQVYAGGGGLFSNESSQPGFVIECFALPEDATSLNENGLVVGVAQGLQKSADSFSNLKSCNALIYAIGAKQAKANKWNDALINNTAGNIIESSIGNIFWVKDGTIFTPPLAEGCVAGVMRRHLLATIAGIEETPLTLETLLDADEAFITNAIKRVKWIGMLGEKKFEHKVIKQFATIL